MSAANPVRAAWVERGRVIVGEFVRSEGFQNFSSERANDFINEPGRAARCYEGAEHGTDGSTHAERIDDMRDYWDALVADRRGREYERVSRAVHAHLDSVEAFFHKAGRLHAVEW